MIETLAVGIVASVLGLVGGFGIAALLKGLFDAVGFALPAGGLVITGTTVIVSLAVGVAVTMAAGLFPAIRAARRPARSVARHRGRTDHHLASAGRGRFGPGRRGSRHRVRSRPGLEQRHPRPRRPRRAPHRDRSDRARARGHARRHRRARLPVLSLAQCRWIAGARQRDAQPASHRNRSVGAHDRRRGSATLFTVFGTSLQTAVTNNVNDAFIGDLAVGTTGFGAGGLSPQLATTIDRIPQVQVATGLTTGQARIDNSSTQISAVDPNQIGAVLDLHPTAGSIATLTADQIGVSQHQADAKAWHLGTALVVTLPDGTKATDTIGAIYASRDLVGDYVLSIAQWSPHTDQKVDSNIFVKVAPGGNVATVQAAVEKVAVGYGKPTVDDHAAFVASSGQGINFVLGIVYVLLALAVVIALFGIANTLSLSIHERTREIGLLRAVGQTRRQLRRTIRLESVIVSLFGTLGGLALGTFLGWGLAEAAHKAQGIASFTVPGTQLVIIAVVGASAGVLAAIRPARRAARLDVLAAVGQE